MNQIKIDLDRTMGTIDRNIFGGFIEHLGRSIYGGIWEPGSPLADSDGIRTDVFNAMCRLQMPILRYPGGNFVSGYRWMDGVGPLADRPVRTDMAWNAVETNQFGTNEFIAFCRKVGAEPNLVVNCGDGDMREARDWVEYCNGTRETTLVKLRHTHGFEAPHQVKYWGVGNEVDGAWEIGYKTPQEYARVYLETSKVMKWIDPTIKLIASGTSDWKHDFVERAQLLFEQAGKYIDYVGIHWYVGNKTANYLDYMATSELIEERLSVYEGLIRAMRFEQKLRNPIALAVDEWNVWYRTDPFDTTHFTGLEEVYNLEDAMLIGIQLNAFIRHARWVKMANLAQIVNALAPILTNPDGLVLQTIFYPFELYSRTCGSTALDIFWQCETFSGSGYSGVRLLDVSATLDEKKSSLSVYVVNRSQTEAVETTVSLNSGRFAGKVSASVVNGPDIKAENTFQHPNLIGTSHAEFTADKEAFTYTFEPHSVTALVCEV